MADIDPNAPPTDAAPAAAAAPSPAPAADNFDVDALVAQYDAATAAPAATAPAAQAEPTAPPVASVQDLLANGSNGAPAGDTLAMMNWMLAVESERQEARDNRDGAVAISHIRGDIDASIYTDAMVGAWVTEIAKTDAKVQRAWENRYQDPKGYERAVVALGRRFAKEHGQFPDRQATEDRELVTAAVRGSGSPPPPLTQHEEQRRWARMSNAEFERERAALYDR